jgi:hypothetical protein
MRYGCLRESFYAEHEGKRYCVLHFPGDGKSAEFKKALQRKRDNDDICFCGVFFPDNVSFRDVEFSGAPDFDSATFSAEADFKGATFTRASFRRTTFTGKADFFGATFTAEADFYYATFSSEADFGATYFGGRAYFENATFADRVIFSGPEEDYWRTPFVETSSLELQSARIEKPDRVSFHSVSLRPHWFVGVDASEFDFIDVDWKWRRTNQEIRSLRNISGLKPHRFLAIACRRLAVNAEENHRYEEASKFRYMSMDARRRESWFGFAPWSLDWWYWLASGYGESVLRALVVLIVILAGFALLYSRVKCVRVPYLIETACMGWEQKQPGADQTGSSYSIQQPAWDFPRALAYSAGVMTLQKPEPRPTTTAAQTAVLLETVLGPVQAALLALAVRRKFMR